MKPKTKRLRRKLKDYNGPSSSQCKSWPTNKKPKLLDFSEVAKIQQCEDCGALTYKRKCEYCSYDK
jgi:hypothetical protein